MVFTGTSRSRSSQGQGHLGVKVIPETNLTECILVFVRRLFYNTPWIRTEACEAIPDLQSNALPISQCSRQFDYPSHQKYELKDCMRNTTAVCNLRQIQSETKFSPKKKKISDHQKRNS